MVPPVLVGWSLPPVRWIESALVDSVDGLCEVLGLLGVVLGVGDVGVFPAPAVLMSVVVVLSSVLRSRCSHPNAAASRHAPMSDERTRSRVRVIYLLQCKVRAIPIFA